MAVNGVSNGDSKTIPGLAKEILIDLFKQDGAPGQWCTLTPKRTKSLDCTPSQSSQEYARENRCDDEVIAYLKEKFDEVFTRVGHVESYWEDFSFNLSHKLGLTFREAQKMDKASPPYNEAKLKHNILHPLFKEVSKAVCIHDNFKRKTITSNYLIEEELETRSVKPGQKPSVDGLIQLSDADGKILALVPVEMKVDMDTDSYSQIACYINKLISAEDVSDYVMVGVIVDKKQFRLAFSVFRNETIPLPIVHISPPIAWKSELSSKSESSIHEHSMLVLVCLLLISPLKRIPYNPPETTHTNRVTPSTLKEMGEELSKLPHYLPRPEQERFRQLSLKRKLDEQQLEIEEIQKRVKKLESAKESKKRN